MPPHKALSLLLCFFAPLEAIRLGAIFRERVDEHLRQAFQYSLAFLQEELGQEIGFVESVVPQNWSLPVTASFCSLLEQGVDLVLAGTDERLNEQVLALADQLDVPVFTVREGGSGRDMGRGLILEMFPEKEHTDAMIDLVKFWDWESLTIVYRDERGPLRLASLLTDKRLDSVFVQLIKVEDGDFLSAAKQMKIAEQCDPSSITSFKHCGDALPRVLLDLDSADVHAFLLAALQVGAIDVHHWYLLASLDMAEMDLSLFCHNHARIIAFRSLNLAVPRLRPDSFLAHLRHFWFTSHPSLSHFPVTDVLLVFDAVYAVLRAQESGMGAGYTGGGASCGLRGNSLSFAQPRAHPHGTTYFNYINSLADEGLSGRLFFSSGRRHNVTFDILQLGYDGIVNKIGTWQEGNETEGVVMNTSVAEHLWNRHINISRRIRTTTLNFSVYLPMHLAKLSMLEAVSNNTQKPHFRITTIAALPYVKRRESEGQVYFEGFCIDLLERLAKDLGFTYSIHLVRDGKYGALDPDATGGWNGMIGEILRDEADMAVAPLTVNYKRSEVVDFTKPFLSLGISILFKIPGPQKPSLFSFMNPLAADIWIYLGVAIVVVTLAMFLIGRISPYEWNPERKICDGLSHRALNGDSISLYAGRVGQPSTHVPAAPPPPLALHNNYSFSGTIWYVASTLMKGGCDFGPKAVSTRLLGGIWWVFTLVIVSAYTANLAAVLTVDRRFIPIKSLEDLANQSRIAYGALGGGSTSQFFRESRIETHMKIWRTMNETGAPIFVSSNEEGVNKTKTENYAYLMESTSLEFAVQQSCSLTQIGGVLGSRGYGIALRKHSEWTDQVSRQILDYGERGIIELMKTKWWKSKYGAACGAGGSAGMKSVRVSLGMENVAGLFVLLVAGILLAVLSVILEFCIKSRQNAELDKASLCQEMAQELCFAVRLNNSKKKHKMGRRCSQCDADTTMHDSTHEAISSQGQSHLHHRPRNGQTLSSQSHT